MSTPEPGDCGGGPLWVILKPLLTNPSLVWVADIELFNSSLEGLKNPSIRLHASVPGLLEFGMKRRLVTAAFPYLAKYTFTEHRESRRHTAPYRVEVPSFRWS